VSKMKESVDGADGVDIWNAETELSSKNSELPLDDEGDVDVLGDVDLRPVKESHLYYLLVDTAGGGVTRRTLSS
jgi:hypothetical protein